MSDTIKVPSFIATMVILLMATAVLAQDPHQQIETLVESTKSSLVNRKLEILETYFLTERDLNAYVGRKYQWTNKDVDTIRIVEQLASHKLRMERTFQYILQQTELHCSCNLAEAMAANKYVIISEKGRNGVPKPMEIFIPLKGCDCENYEMWLRIEDCFFLGNELKLGDGFKLEKKPTF